MGRSPLSYEESKRKVNVNVKNVVLDEAIKKNLNISKVLEDSLVYLLKNGSSEELEKYSKK